MVRPLLTVALCGVFSILVGPVSAGLPEKYKFKPGLTATYDFEVEVHERDRIVVWKGSPIYTVTNVEGAAANLQYMGSFLGTYRPRDEAANAGRQQPGQRGTSHSSMHSSLRVAPRGEASGAPRSQELPLPLGPTPLLPIVVLPEMPGDHWETKRESELGLVSTFVAPQQNGPGIPPPFVPFDPFGGQRAGGFAFEERLHLTETVSYAAKADSTEFERTCAIVSAETIGEKPRVEFASTGTVTFSEDGFLPARVEWSGAITLRTGSGEVTSPVKASARRLSAAELDERAAAAEQARLAAAEKLRGDLGQLVEDLRSGDEHKARAAASRLDTDLIQGGDAVVAAALHQAYKDADGNWQNVFGRALGRWATAQQADILIELVEGDDISTRRAAIERLGELRAEKAIPAIAARMRDNFDRHSAQEALKKFGSAAETAVIELLGHKDWQVRQQAIELLKTIGTGKSIAPLKKAEEDKNPFVKQSAEAAVKAIEERVNAPVT